MSKKLLKEATVRRFMGLAGMDSNIVSNAINEMYSEKDEAEHDAAEEMYMKEEEEDADPVDDAADMGMDDEPKMDDEPMMDDEPEMDDDLMSDVPEESREAMGKAVMQAVADALGLDVDISGAEEPMEEPMEEAAHEDKEEMDHPMEEGAHEDKEETYMKEETEIEEALDGVSTELTEDEIIQEVAARVARRILKAKKAHKEMNEALGKK